MASGTADRLRGSPAPSPPPPPPLPGMNKVQDKQIQEVERKYAVYESMIQSMTKKEREQPEVLAKSPSRRWVAQGTVV